MGSHPQSSGLPLITWSVTPDEVVAVEPCGSEDVFDLQIAHTENFIANGLVSHNTRWHEDDLAGRLLAREPNTWTVLRIPAIAEDNDPLGRQPGEELVSVQGREPGYFRDLKAKRSPYVWLSIYMQAPTAAEGMIFKKLWWRYWHRAPDLFGERIDCAGRIWPVRECWRFATADLAASTKTSADWTVFVAWMLTHDGDLVALDMVRARVGEGEHFSLVRPLVERWGLDTVFVERSQFGTTLAVDAARAGVPLTPLDADTDKLTRALPASNRAARGRFWLPAGGAWLEKFIGETAAFPGGTHDDIVDNVSYAARVAVAEWAPHINTADVARQPTGEVDFMKRPM